MSRVRCIHLLALLLPFWADASLAKDGPSLYDNVATHEVDAAGLELRLADGSLLLVPFNAAGKRVVGRADRTASEDPAAEVRRKAPPHPARLFDPEPPGVIASVRG